MSPRSYCFNCSITKKTRVTFAMYFETISLKRICYLENSVRPKRNFLLIFGFLTLDDGTDRLFRNVGKELPLFAA